MNVFLALFLLGLIQGLTEFLPVSSSGHLVLFSKIFGVEESLFLSIILHVATLLSIVVVFRKEIWQILRHPFSNQSMMIVIATIPTCLIALVLMPIIKSSFSGALLPYCFLISAIMLFCSEIFSKKQIKNTKIDAWDSFWIGVAQGFAIFPGISRSGATISAGLLRKNDRKSVAKFSFLLSIPIILMSLVMEIFEIFTGGLIVSFQFWPVAISFLTAFVVGVFSIKFMIKMTEKANLKWFSIYLISIAALSFVLI